MFTPSDVLSDADTAWHLLIGIGESRMIVFWPSVLPYLGADDATHYRGTTRLVFFNETMING